jgi:hypothetical protein
MPVKIREGRNKATWLLKINNTRKERTNMHPK